MLKNILRSVAQKLIGFERYLYVFSMINIYRIWFLGGDKEFVFFVDSIKKAGTIIDIGANIGFTTVLLAKKFPFSTVYAFEPMPANIKAMQKVISSFRLNNIIIIPEALGNEAGKVKMQMPVANHARMQGLSHVIEDSTDANAAEEGITVSLQMLDNYTAIQNENSIAAIKIDVENFEYFVLKGGEQLIRKHRPIIFCELWNNERRILCIKFIKELGYQIKIWKKGELVDFKEQETLNFFFLP